MPLGRPSISTPNALQLQSLQQTVANIRERFAAIEVQILADEQTVTNLARNGASDLRQLRALIDALDFRVRQLEAAGGGGGGTPGDDLVFQAAEALSEGAPVWLSADGIVSAIDPDDPAAAAGFIGITTQAVAAGDPVQVRVRGLVEIPSAAFTVGRQVYAAAGGVTQEPAGNALPVGAAVTATAISVAPGTLALAAAGFIGESFLPVTYALAQAAIDLADLFDLTMTPGPQDGDSLVFDGTLGKYVPGPGGSGGGVLPVVTGEVPPVFVYFDDGSLLYSGI